MSAKAAASRIELIDLQPTGDTLAHDVRSGLARRPPVLPPKYFYDRLGALLFERITTLDEYYLTRTEAAILATHAPEIAARAGPGARVIEFGSGSGSKTELLLRHLQEPVAYVPIDISCGQLVDFAATVAQRFPLLEVRPVCADYTGTLRLPVPSQPAQSTLAFFPGSTIGNFEPDDAAAFLRRIARLCGPGGRLLIGTDLVKPAAVLAPAYNDAEGVTAAFNLNLLARINRECGADFDIAAFDHLALWDADRHRIEMRLVACRDTTVTLPADGGAPPLHVRFAAGDHIVTEYSHKYTKQGFAALAARTGWRVAGLWTDERGWFGVWLLAAEGKEDGHGEGGGPFLPASSLERPVSTTDHRV